MLLLYRLGWSSRTVTAHCICGFSKHHSTESGAEDFTFGRQIGIFGVCLCIFVVKLLTGREWGLSVQQIVPVQQARQFSEVLAFVQGSWSSLLDDFPECGLSRSYFEVTRQKLKQNPLNG